MVKRYILIISILSIIFSNIDSMDNSDEIKMSQRPDGTIVHEFRNGLKIFLYPDGSSKIRYSNGDESIIYPDKTVIRNKRVDPINV